MRLAAAVLFFGILVVIVPESPQAFQWRSRPVKQGFLWRAAKDPDTIAVETSKGPVKTDRPSSKESSKFPSTGELGNEHPSTREPGTTGMPGTKLPGTGELGYKNPRTREPGTTGMPGTKVDRTGEPGSTGMPGTSPTGIVSQGGPTGTGTVVSHAPVTTDLICSTGGEDTGAPRATAPFPIRGGKKIAELKSSQN